jgi:hypothetical protein
MRALGFDGEHTAEALLGFPPAPLLEKDAAEVFLQTRLIAGRNHSRLFQFV